MVTSCCVVNCTNSVKSQKKISFYRFPTVKKRFNEEYRKLLTKRREAWFVAVKRQNVDRNQLDHLRICSEHFTTGQPADFRDCQHPDWIPHVNMGYQNRGVNPVGKVGRYQWVANRENENENKRTQVEDLQNQSNLYIVEVNQGLLEENLTDNSIAVQTEITSSLLAAMEKELLERTEEVYRLRDELAYMKMTEDTFKNNDKKLKYYTGLPNLKLFMVILAQINSALNNIKVTKLSNFQKLLLTLMKLRFNTTFVGLGYRFDIKSDQASYCFKNVIILLEYSLRYVVPWPDRDCLRTAMPESYKRSFGNSVSVIIDSFEISAQIHANIKPKAQSFPSCTSKYLIGIMPHGHVSFISDGWGGCVSDKVMLEKSGILDLLLPGDVVLGDQGFTIKESVSMQYAELLTLDSLHRHVQLPLSVVEKMRNISTIRTYVKRVIGNVRNKFELLKGPVPIDFFKYKHEGKYFLDYIIRTCCILVNLCNSLVPLKTAKCRNSNEDVLDDIFTDDFQYCA